MIVTYNNFKRNSSFNTLRPYRFDQGNYVFVKGCNQNGKHSGILLVIGIFNQDRKNKKDNGSRGKNHYQGGDHLNHYLFQGDNLPDTKKGHGSKQYYQKNQKIGSNFLHKIHGIKFNVQIDHTKVQIISQTVNCFWVNR